MAHKEHADFSLYSIITVARAVGDVQQPLPVPVEPSGGRKELLDPWRAVKQQRLRVVGSPDVEETQQV